MREAYHAILDMARRIGVRVRIRRTWVFETIGIWTRRKQYRHVRLNEAQEREIDDLWRPAGLRYRKYRRWFRLYLASSDHFDPRALPEILYSTKVEPQLNDLSTSARLADKALTELLLAGVPGVDFPATKILRSHGLYYNQSRIPISELEAIESLRDAGEVIIKPSVGSSSGRGIGVFEFSRGMDLASGRTIGQVVATYSTDFIIQGIVAQHPDYAAPHAESLNTVRLVTYTMKGHIYHWPVVFRMGVGSRRVDNAHAGGIYIGVRDDGSLLPFALDTSGKRYYRHPTTELLFAGHVLPAIPELIELGKRLLGHLPGLGIVSWDFALREDGTPVLVEANVTGQSIWLSQLSHGVGAFGDRTEEVLAMVGSRRPPRKLHERIIQIVKTAPSCRRNDLSGGIGTARP